jgi:hypothetical protein
MSGRTAALCRQSNRQAQRYLVILSALIDVSILADQPGGLLQSRRVFSCIKDWLFAMDRFELFFAIVAVVGFAMLGAALLSM